MISLSYMVVLVSIISGQHHTALTTTFVTMSGHNGRYEARTLGGVADLMRAGRAYGLSAFCVNPECKRGGGVRLDIHNLVDLLGRDRLLRDVLITCSVCHEDGRDRTQTNLAVEMRVENSVPVDPTPRWIRARQNARS